MNLAETRTTFSSSWTGSGIKATRYQSSQVAGFYLRRRDGNHFSHSSFLTTVQMPHVLHARLQPWSAPPYRYSTHPSLDFPYQKPVREYAVVSACTFTELPNRGREGRRRVSWGARRSALQKAQTRQGSFSSGEEDTRNTPSST